MSVKKQVSVHGRRAYVTPHNQLAAANGFVAGGIDKPAIVLPGAPDTVAMFQDFLSVIDDTGAPFPGGGFRAVVGDTGHGFNTPTGTNGILRLFHTVSTAAPKAPGAGLAVGHGRLAWAGDQGPGPESGRLRFGARLKTESVNRSSKRVHIFAGFTDNAVYEYPAYDTGAGVISNASDYMGFMLSPGGDTGWSAVAGKSTAGDSGDQLVHLSADVTANKYNVVELEYTRSAGDTGGRVTFFIDGDALGSFETPIASSTRLSPCIYAFQQDTGGERVEIDWINVSAPRDTGT